MKYQIRREEADPFDIMCSDCPIHYIEWYENITEDELMDLHSLQLNEDKWLPDFQKQIWLEDGIEWQPTEPNFKKWLWQSIKQGYIRIV